MNIWDRDPDGDRFRAMVRAGLGVTLFVLILLAGVYSYLRLGGSR